MIFEEKVLPKNRKFYSTTQKAYAFGVFAHVMSLCIFWFTGVYSLVYFNIGVSLPAFLLALLFNRQGKHELAFGFAFVELYFHQLCGAYVLGWAAGFQFWFIYLAGLCFYNPYWSRRLKQGLLSVVSATFTVTFFFVPHELVGLAEGAIGVTAIGNGMAALVAIGMLISHFAKVAFVAQRGLREVNEELWSTNEEIQTKNKEIIESISYAESIQRAIIPNEDFLAKHFEAHFVLFRPKDIVSGDFYWFAEVAGKVVVVCADCTGHGVPGGFMSMLSISLLNEVVNKLKILKPADMLEELRTKTKEALEHGRDKYEQKDGMDLSVCVFDMQRKRMAFAGANNGIYVIRNGDLLMYKPTKNPIGDYPVEIPFSDQDIELEKGDKVYFYTDGYPDQFGGKKGRKFMQKQLKTVLVNSASVGMVAQKEALNECFEAWKGMLDQVDDCTLIGVEI